MAGSDRVPDIKCVLLQSCRQVKLQLDGAYELLNSHCAQSRCGTAVKRIERNKKVAECILGLFLTPPWPVAKHSGMKNDARNGYNALIRGKNGGDLLFLDGRDPMVPVLAG